MALVVTALPEFPQFATGGGPRVWAAIPGGTLDPTLIPKYAQPLVIPPAMPAAATGGIDLYQIAVRQFKGQILPPGFPPTTVWSYGSILHPSTFHYPAFTIEARHNKPVVVNWINDLKDQATGRFLPHILPVDPTLHWANPPGGNNGRDKRPKFTTTPGPYTGPVPLITHLHGGHSAQEFDGHPEAWYLPAANNIPAGYATTGTYHDIFRESRTNPLRRWWQRGAAAFRYDNDQRAATLWYHDHSLGMTRLNVYAGPAGFYLLRGGPDDLHDHKLPGPAPSRGDPPGIKYYEIPIVIQDRSFNADGSLFYPNTRQFFDGFAGPYVPGSDVPPVWNPEFFGNTMVVNGLTWPFLEVEQRRYRFRFLNGCNSRFLILKNDNGLPFWQIGTEGGFLPAPVQLTQLLLGNAERADCIVDFTNVPVGTTITLLNLGPDEPFGGGAPNVDFAAADPATTGQVMQFRVKAATSRDTSTPPDKLVLPRFRPLGNATNTRQVSLNEAVSAVLPDTGPTEALLGTVGNGIGVPKAWMDRITENPALGATEVWEIHNFTEDAHPIHIHEITFQVVNRQPFGNPNVRLPESWESGYKDTVIAYPGQITRIKARFDRPGLFVWHCHIVEHEDNEMMRPYRIGKPGDHETGGHNGSGDRGDDQKEELKRLDR
ncbi:MAG: multicopper oxidase [Chloroflexi bacterium]|nr:multicopper oxidase [Chloroflexota bacterium]